MSDDTNVLERRSGRPSWLVGQLNIPNVLALVAAIAGVVSWQRSSEARNEIQDLKIQAIERRLDGNDMTYARRDLLEQQLAGIRDSVERVEKKVDGITRAVR